MTIDDIDAEIAIKLKAIAAIEQNPKHQMPPGGLWLYTKTARKKLDALRLDIAQLASKKRALQGNPVDQSGYSGRQTNRR